jgi:predicted enzyme related to lactoylglutathione lyase
MSDDALGHFVWYELMTTDPGAAEEFYPAVTGWGTAPFEGLDFPYTTWMRGEMRVGGVMELPEEARAAGAPPHWVTYVSTPDLDATVARAVELGASVRMPAKEIPVGRFAVLVDPQGAELAVFQGTAEPQGDREPEIGEISWHELATTDWKAAWEFYSALFGWVKTSEFDMGEMGTYWMFGRIPELTLGAMFDKPAAAPGPPFWGIYVRVADVHAAVETVKARGGQVINGPMEVPGDDWIVQCLDPQGAMVSFHHKAG